MKYEVCRGAFDYSGSNGVTAIFVMRPEIHAFAGGLP